MIDLSFGMAKKSFFDRPAVLTALSRAERRVLSKFGAFVRTRAKTSIRRRRAASLPGQPPSSHLGLLRDFIFFVFDPSRRSVLVGPVRLNHASGGAPEVLEYGGTAAITWGRNPRVVRIAPRPYMQPALAAELPGLPKLWADSIRNS
jgi:hypothetical protein